MKVFTQSRHMSTGAHSIHIAPGAHEKRENCPEEWFDHDGTPKQMVVAFMHGVAEVDDQVGRYLLAHRLAGRSRLIIPEGVDV